MANKQSNSLNIIIITIAAMILLFTLVGRFINSSIDKGSKKGEQVQITPERSLSMIDFGLVQIVPTGKYWHKKTDDKSSTNAIRKTDWTKLGNTWKALLFETSHPPIPIETQNISSTYFVQLYFVEISNPIIAKIMLIKDADKNNDQLVVNFVASNSMIFKPMDSIYDLLPNIMIKNSDMENLE